AGPVAAVRSPPPDRSDSVRLVHGCDVPLGVEGQRPGRDCHGFEVQSLRDPAERAQCQPEPEAESGLLSAAGPSGTSCPQLLRQGGSPPPPPPWRPPRGARLPPRPPAAGAR